MNTFQFPAGTTKISQKELIEAFKKYERVEIPGSVLNVDVRTSDHILSIKKLVLNEGTRMLRLFIPKAISVNVPKSLLEIETNAHLPRFLCLSESFIRLRSIKGVEYLQAYGESEVRYCFLDSKLKHYVVLGQKLSSKLYLFDDIPAGCVIHVESDKMAEKVLKRGGFDITKVYVVADAAEWKDFPADKLALTAEEYDPESRISPAQIKLQKKLAEKQAQEEAEEAQKEREQDKGRIMRNILLPLVDKCLSDKDLEYKVAKTAKEGKLAIQFQFSTAYMHASIDVESPEESLTQVVEAALQVKDLIVRYKEDIATLSIRFRESCGYQDNPIMSIPLATASENLYIIGEMYINSLTENAAVISTFASELNQILIDSKGKGIRFNMSNEDRIRWQ